MENPKDVYVSTNSYNLWWGIYGLCPLTGWEDIFIYDDPYGVNKLGSTCICTKDYLSHVLEDLADDPEEREFQDHIIEYLNGDKIHYHFFYDNPSDEDFYQLPYSNLPLNEYGVKPRSFEMWHPNNGIDIAVIEECVKVFCDIFLNLAVNRVQLLEQIDVEGAIVSYKEHLSNFNGEIVFSDNLINDMMNKLSKSKDEVMKLLKISIKG
ncbi:hypothetical protein [Paenibacillus sp. DYY-L-2]|uniref:hypothetical protein n=1 Tax=Paenibacillus sp. DYY-L-2 TaxID=3447013 RepID=UPI003F4FC523